MSMLERPGDMINYTEQLRGRSQVGGGQGQLRRAMETMNDGHIPERPTSPSGQRPSGSEVARGTLVASCTDMGRRSLGSLVACA